MSFDWGAVISTLCAINLFMLGLLWKRLTSIEEKLDMKLGKEECNKCARDIKKEIDDVWQAHGKHSHTGLDGASRVIR